MRRVPIILALGIALAVHAVPSRSMAASLYGTWRSSSGNVFEITESRRGGFKLRVTYANGTQSVLRGDWVAGLEGTQFTYWDASNNQYTGTFNPRDPDRVRVVVGSTVSWWQRYSHAVSTPPRRAKIFGFWRSTSGNVFEITEARRGGFKLWMTSPNGRRIVMRGDWVRGMAGTQFVYWNGKVQHTGTFSPDDPDRVRVVVGDAVTWWQRSDGAAPPPPPPPPPAYDCWAANDPGCERTKGGYLPMDRNAFNAFYQSVGSARPHVYPMLDRVRSGVQAGYLTSRQLAAVLELFKPHVYPMLDAVKACAPRLVDPDWGAGVVADKFRPHTQVGSQAASIVSAQRSDPPRRR